MANENNIVRNYIREINSFINSVPVERHIGSIMRYYYIENFKENVAVEKNLDKEQIIQGVDEINIAIDSYNRMNSLEGMS